MSPWSDRRRQWWLLYTGVTLIVVGMVAGLLLTTGAIGGGDESGPEETPRVGATPPQDDPGPSETAGSAEPPGPTEEEPLLEVVSWGVASGQLAIEVRNRSPRVIEQMQVRITAVDASGAVVLSTTGAPRDLCCTVVGLPTGRSFGLFAPVDRPSAKIAAVEVEPVSTTLGQRRPKVRVVTDDPRLVRAVDDTTAIVDLVARAGSPRVVAVQAFLTDESGRVGQVISGRFCLNMHRREIRLRLFHAVPDILDLDRVVAYAFPPGVSSYLPWRCR